jgi:hypothetical protein
LKAEAADDKLGADVFRPHDAVTLEEDVIVIAQRNIPLDILP